MNQSPPPSKPPRKLKDVYLICAEYGCGIPFIWDVGEQEFLYSLLEVGRITKIEEPKRCLSCRAKRRAFYANKES